MLVWTDVPGFKSDYFRTIFYVSRIGLVYVFQLQFILDWDAETTTNLALHIYAIGRLLSSN